MNIALVDDVQMEMERIKIILKNYAATNSLNIEIDSFSSGEEFLSAYEPFRYSIVFMDIYMNGMSGVDVAKRLRTLDPNAILIFLTGSADHMPDAFRCHAFDYLQKPAKPKDLYRVMDDIIKKCTNLEGHLTFSCNKTDYSIPYGDIIAVCAADHYLEITDKAGKVYKVRATFSSVSKQLIEDNRFLLIIRGTLVNMDYIVCFRDGSCHLKGNMQLPISLRNSKKLEQIWNNYTFTQQHNTNTQ